MMKNIVATFSIVAFDPEMDSLGVAVQSKFLGVGAVMPWAKAGAGAIATQAMANYSYGPRGIELLAQGNDSEKTVEVLTAEDSERENRQLGVVDANGRPATFTGGECFEWAGGITGEHYAAQGNILVGQETAQAMGETFETAGATSPRVCSPRSTPGGPPGETVAECSLRRSSSCAKTEDTAATTTGSWTCAWTNTTAR